MSVMDFLNTVSQDAKVREWKRISIDNIIPNKDNKEKINMKAESIIVVGKLTDDLINIAKTNNLKIIYVEGRW